MKRAVDILRFFRVVPPVPRLLTLSTAAIVCACAAIVVSEPARAADALTPLLAVQLFAASTGFTAPARRGFYDFVLTAGINRVSIALVQWLTAVAPVIAGWVSLAGIEGIVTGYPPTLMSSGSAAAMFVVSTLPWAVTTGLPRFSGAIGWVLAAVIAVTLLPTASDAPWQRGAPGNWLDAWAFLLFPSRLAGRDAFAYWPEVLPGLMVSACAMALAILWIHRVAVPLEAAQ